MRNDQKALSDIYSRIITESNGRKIVEGAVILERLYLTELPEWLADVEVDGNFSCAYNLLTSLKNSPKKVNGGFFCYGNRLTSLAGAPKILTLQKRSSPYAQIAFHCGGNNLTTLEGGPEIVEGDYYCSENQLTSLVGAPEEVSILYCSYNRLQTLEGIPRKIRRGFYCLNNQGRQFTKDEVQALSQVDRDLILLGNS
jgi:hypothetical protein